MKLYKVLFVETEWSTLEDEEYTYQTEKFVVAKTAQRAEQVFLCNHFKTFGVAENCVALLVTEVLMDTERVLEIELIGP